MHRCWARTSGEALLTLALLASYNAGLAQENPADPQEVIAASQSALVEQFFEQNCLDCHDHESRTAELALDEMAPERIPQQALVWEKVVRKLRTRQMPPPDMPHPSESSYQAVLTVLEFVLDRNATAHPQPGRTETFRRLNRAEYRNAIRDLLALDVDITDLLPADESSHGFDNITVDSLSPTLLNRYVTAAQKISRLAVGRTGSAPGGDTFRIPADVTQEEHVEGLPLGTRGGTVIHYTFPQDGEYEFQIVLARDRDEHVEGLNESHELVLLLDREQERSFTVAPPHGEAGWSADHSQVDQHLKVRLHVTAGEHAIGVAFLKNPTSLLETKRQPLNVHFNVYRHPRIGPAVYQISITGPFEATGPGDTASRRQIFVTQPTVPAEEEACAQQILARLMRRAYRRPIEEIDLKKPLELFRESKSREGFEAGIEAALSCILVNPNFLFHIELDPPDVPPGTAYRISDVELASRLAFFLWSSIPDDELLDLAAAGELSDPQVLEQQTMRMLADVRARALVENFAGQWLYLRNLESSAPDMRLFPDFDDNLRQAFRQETELFFESVMREDRSVLELIKSDYTFLNERLAKHYGIPNVYGSRFRRVQLDQDSKRGGLLRQGSILTVTSYATRTSPVIRGKWVMQNLLGTPPPPPPPNVPPLKGNTVLASLSVRERLAEHRKNPTCASCHSVIDPVGLALEKFDAVGRWREMEAGKPIDASAGLPDGSEFTGVDGLEQGLVNRPEIFVGTMTEKLLTYALGRGVELYDAPAVREIVRDAAAADYRFSSLILGVVKSTPFRMRMTE